MLESYLHDKSSFVTLTYDEDHIPDGETLVPKDTQDWLKRFRKAIEPHRIRYFLVGEYGEETQRPHYHAALFNYPPCDYRELTQGSSRERGCCVSCDTIRDTWGKGRIFNGLLEPHSAQYIAGYVTKKMTGKDDPRLFGRHPEFTRSSKRPGIGADFMHFVASEFMKFNLENTQVDVPSTLRHGPKELPLGRYLQKRLRKLVGKDEKAPQAVLDKISKELQPLREAAKHDEENPGLKYHVLQASKGAIAKAEFRHNLRKKKGSI